MASEDDALLRRELHWKSRTGDRRRPAGANAILAMALVITLALWAITGVVLGRLLAGRPTSSGVVDPISLVVLIVFGVEMFIAAGVAGRIWIAIGPTARSILRPFGILGPWPMLIVGFFVAVSIVAFVAAPFMSTPQPERGTSGRNWHMVTTDRGGVTLDEAVQLCKQTGGLVPRPEDLDALDPPFTGRTTVWLEPPAGENVELMLAPDGTVSREIPPPGQIRRVFVLCFRP